MSILLIAFLLLAVLTLVNVRVVSQSQNVVVERLGRFLTVWNAGLHMKLPFIDRIIGKISLKERVGDFEPQSVITKDNVLIEVDTIVFYQVTDAKLFTYGAEHPITAIRNLTATTLRNVVGDLALDDLMTSREIINAKLMSILDEATDRWGIKINRVELKDILPPKSIQDAMEKQMKAEREKRKLILEAEGTRDSQILVADGEKTAAIIRAEAQKESAILKAEGEATAIELVQEASARALERLTKASPSDKVLTLKSLEAFAAAADGKATKIIIPSEIQGIAGLATALKSLTDTADPK